jgi:hypothetical protein
LSFKYFVCLLLARVLRAYALKVQRGRGMAQAAFKASAKRARRCKVYAAAKVRRSGSSGRGGASGDAIYMPRTED